MYSISGSQFIVGQHGHQFNFNGEPGKTYDLCGVGNLTITGRVLGFTEPQGTAFDRITLKTGQHTVQVGHDEILIDGKPATAAHKQPGDWVWVNGERVTVSADDWIIGVYLDNGNDPIHQDGCLKNRQHVSFSMHKILPDGAHGVLVEGFHGLDASFFEVE